MCESCAKRGIECKTDCCLYVEDLFAELDKLKEEGYLKW